MKKDYWDVWACPLIAPMLINGYTPPVYIESNSL